MSVSAVRVSAKTSAKNAIIFVHGLGDSGEGWSWFPQVLRSTNTVSATTIDSTNFVFPNAPIIPITVNGGYRMPGWFDIYELGNAHAKQDEEGTLRSCEVLKQLVKEQIEVYNVPSERIIIGGFSQGAALALATGALLDVKIGGIVALSGFCPVTNRLGHVMNDTNANFETPIFQGHGTADPVIPFEFGQATQEFYGALGFKNYQFKSYSGVEHTACDEELGDVARFIKSILE